MQPGLCDVQHSRHGNGVGSRAVGEDHIQQREHRYIVVHERRHDEGLLSALLVTHILALAGLLTL